MGAGNVLSDMLNGLLNGSANGVVAAAALEQLCHAGNIGNGSDSAANAAALMANTLGQLMGTADSMDKFNLTMNNYKSAEGLETGNDAENVNEESKNTDLLKLLSEVTAAKPVNDSLWKGVCF